MLLVTSCDTGSANALAPVLADLNSDYRLYAQADAARVFARWGILYEPVGAMTWEDLRSVGTQLLSRYRGVSAVVTGTSWGPTIDKALTLAAREQRVPCAALVEHWDLYLERFSVVKGGEISDPGCFFPDRIWVNDSIAMLEGAIMGLPAEKLEVVGQPHLEWQLNQLLERMHGVQRRNEVVFVSERVGTDFVAGGPLYRGFDEYSVLKCMIKACAFSDCQLTVKLHPQEDFGKFDDLLNGRSGIEVVKDADNIEMIARSRYFVGMFSMLLLEAALVRSDVFSFFPGGDPSIFIGNRIGATVSLTNDEDLRVIIDKPFDESRNENISATAFGKRFVGSKVRLTNFINRFVS